LVLRQQRYGVRQLANLLAYRVIDWRGLLRRGSSLYWLRLPFYRTVLKPPTLPTGVVLPDWRNGLLDLFDLFGYGRPHANTV